ncbi:MAG: HAMP domain-containing histidine kinase [Erysipelotrichaceae bacterium]|nr:HAMP domain-containing histidine kinase [Erysipelotrichaceae bacterium]
MKRFLRSIAGKTVSFIVCIIAVCVLAASMICAGLMFEGNYYTQTKDQVFENIVTGRIHRDACSEVWSAVSNSEDEPLVVSNEQFTYEIVNDDGEVIGRSEDASNIKEWVYSYEYGVLRNDEGYVDDVFYHDKNVPRDDGAEYYTFNANIRENPNINSYSTTGKIVDLTYPLRYWVYLIGIAALLSAIASFIVLMANAGRRNDSEELYPGPLNKIPFDVLAGLYLIFGAACFAIVGQNYHLPDEFIVAAVIDLSLIFLVLFVGLCISMAVRIKQKSLIKGSLTYLCLKYLWTIVVYVWGLLKKLMKSVVFFINSIPLVWKTAVITLGLVFIEFLFLVNSYSDYYTAFWLIRNLVLIPAVICISLNLKTLQQGGIALANGDLSYHVDTKRMLWDFRKHGENLNSIANGMSIAVEDRLKSERMKTELITNVSHDIKTPLTSIINYADLIGKEKTSNKKINEYTEVLLRQSERLKRLIDDLVEASKASTGNLEVDLMPCDAATFVNQTAGEYQDRLKECDLTLITEVPEEGIRIMADGRRMYRIFDNLMNNICKYAQSGTRVYLSLERKDNDALFVFRNTSREQLNISEDELMERFTRGDQSRNTEGNGLGLSIAKSMAELQNGSLKIVIDGDLFKANLSFPIID